MAALRALPTDLPGLVVLEPERFDDPRGFVLESYRRGDLESLGLPADFAQDTHARSAPGVLRGLHFQRRPGQHKLIRVVRGAIWDVAVDLRRGSPTFRRHVGLRLDGDTPRMLLVPRGFAHGYLVLDDGDADVTYKVSSPYDPAEERGVAWDDPELAVAWPARPALLSSRDAALPRLGDVPEDDLPEPELPRGDLPDASRPRDREGGAASGGV